MPIITFFLSVCQIKFTSIVRTYVLYFSTSKTAITNYYIFFGVLNCSWRFTPYAIVPFTPRVSIIPIPMYIGLVKFKLKIKLLTVSKLVCLKTAGMQTELPVLVLNNITEI